MAFVPLLAQDTEAVVVTGAVKQPLELTAGDLGKIPRASVCLCPKTSRLRGRSECSLNSKSYN